MASSVAGHRRAFGADTVPGLYEDLDAADLIILAGSNAAWCHPVLFQRMQANRASRGARLVVIDPRRTASAEDADLFLSIQPGSDSVLFSGLLVFLVNNGAIDQNYIGNHTEGFDAALARAREIAPDIATIAQATALRESDIAAFFDLFLTTQNVVTCYSQGINQSHQGTDKVGAIINCHLASGRIGRPGMGPFSLTGQPNAMGGREVGGLANQLAAHMNFTPDDISRVERFWRAPRIAQREGLKAVDLFAAIDAGKVKALWVLGTNPAVSLPQADGVRRALRKLDFLALSENVLSNDSVQSGAHLLLPALAWGEKSGTVTNSERRMSRQRAFLDAPGEARPDWWAVCEVAKRLGFGESFAYRSEADIFREHAALSGFENGGSRDFDIGALADLSDADYDAMAPTLWPKPAQAGEGARRFFADGRFYTANGRANFIAIDPPRLAQNTSSEKPLRLNTGRIRDQWHTMTRSGEAPRLGQHLPEPFVEIHPDDARAHRLKDGGHARLTSSHGQCVLKVFVTESQQRGSLFAPIHWSAETAAHARIGALVAAITDPYSGQPEAKATPVTIAPVRYARRSFILSRSPIAFPAALWWSRVATPGGYGYLVADNFQPDDWRQIVPQDDSDRAEYVDSIGAQFRVAQFDQGRISFCLFSGPAEHPPQWDHVRALFEKDVISTDERRHFLSGRSLVGGADLGPLVCACFAVRQGKIADAIASGCASVEAIGAALKAGTNCGSCVPELKKMIATSAPQNAA